MEPDTNTALTEQKDSRDAPATYEFRLRALGNEVFAVSLSTSNSSNRWTILSITTILITLVLLGTYGGALVESYKTLSHVMEIEQFQEKADTAK